jgi:hypothetical protein
MSNIYLRVFSVIALIIVANPTAWAASDQQRAERKIEEGAGALLEGMRLLLKSIPWYGQPVIMPNGDIVIPRRDGPPLPAPRKKSAPSADDDGDGDTTRL